MKHIITMEWLSSNLNASDVVVADCRFMLGNAQAGRNAYEAGHIPGAVYLDLEQDLSAPVSAHGGRHPLPEAAELAEKLGSVGIHSDTKVIAYDDQGGAMASRLWWLLQYLGHKNACILDGGFSAWQAAGYPVTTEIPNTNRTTFVPNVQKHMVLSMEEVRARLNDPRVVLIDSREAPRYQGLMEPIDPAAGHIPGAVNYFWKEGLTAENRWKPAVDQKQRFANVDPGKEIIVYCGSGVTACPNILALQEAGYAGVKLYSGSWSDWCSYPDNPIATGEE